MFAIRLLLVLVAFLSACKRDDGDSGGKDGGTAGQGDDAGGVDAGPPCSANADCDDGLFCTGEETCDDGVCVAGAPVTCDDGVACTIDACSERTRECDSLPPDLDGDGHYDVECEDDGGKSLGDDCDDNDPLSFPGNIESCDPEGKDEDCDPKTFGDKDADDDGYFDGLCCNGKNCGTDCDDLKASVSPKATEACDLFDNDCDGKTDEDVSRMMYPDEDRDGHGAEGGAKHKCAGTVGYALEPNDCDDNDPEVFEGQFEICDAKDNDCDDDVDEVQQDAPWFTDVDEDSFGDATSTPIYSCERIPGRVLSNNDCDDEDPAIHPAAAEACDAVDNDCSGTKDFRLATNDFEDDDNDGIADSKCTGGQDCADTDATSGKGLDEVCDTRDNDCDKAIDEDTAQTVWYLDRDGDGWGVDLGTALARCEPIPGRAANLGDCDDDVNAVHPTALEVCNGVDENCNAKADEGTNYQCSVESGVGYCKLGGCAILSCYPGFGDCDGKASNGCECDAPIVPFQIGCSVDADCDDHEYCNGKERCTEGDCYRGTPINCDASESVLQGSIFIFNSLDIQMLAGVEIITGDLVISASGLLNLTGLEALKTVGGDLIIDGNLPTTPDVYSNQSLTALVGSGLSNLATVTGDLIIEDNPKLTVIRLPSLVTVGGLLRIANNQSLTTLDGFDALVKVTGALEVSDNFELAKFSGMKLLTSTGGLLVENNPIDKLSLPQLLRVRGDFSVRPNGEYSAAEIPLTSLTMAKLTQIDGSFTVMNNGQLTTLSLPLLKRVLGHDFRIYDCDSLDDPDLHSLEQFTAVDLPLQSEDAGQFDISENAGLTTIDRLGAIECAVGQCDGSFYNNGALSSCDIEDWVQMTSSIFVSWIGNDNSNQACSDGNNG
jgi:Putative metal-binding motif/Receptor L domain